MEEAQQIDVGGKDDRAKKIIEVIAKQLFQPGQEREKITPPVDAV